MNKGKVQGEIIICLIDCVYMQPPLPEIELKAMKNVLQDPNFNSRDQKFERSIVNLLTYIGKN